MGYTRSTYLKIIKLIASCFQPRAKHKQPGSCDTQQLALKSMNDKRPTSHPEASFQSPSTILVVCSVHTNPNVHALLVRQQTIK